MRVNVSLTAEGIYATTPVRCEISTLIFYKKSEKTDAVYWGECLYFPEVGSNANELIGAMSIWKKGQDINHEKPLLTRTYMTRFPGVHPVEPDLRSAVPETSWEACFQHEIKNIDGE